MFKKTLIASLLAAAGVSAFAADYYVVVPLPGKQHLLDGISVALNSSTLPTGLVGVPYVGFDLSQALQVTGDPAYSSTNVGWSVVAGALPGGLVLNKGVLSGTPTTAGAQAFSVRATYKTKTGEQAYSILTFAVTVALATGTLPQGVVGVAYPTYDIKPLLTVVGDANFNLANVTWSVVSSTLPSGLTLKADGTISGTPTTSGTGAITARASYKGVNGDQTYQVVTLAITVALTGATLPAGVQGALYSYDLKPQLTVSGDPGYTGAGVTWDLASGTLPTGLSLNASTGVITGTPTAEGTSSFSARATYRTKTGAQTYQVIVGAITVSLASATLPTGVLAQAYSFDLKTKLTIAGDAAYAGTGVTWSLALGTLPVGLSLGTDGVITGTPTTVSTKAFTAQAGYKTKVGQQNYSIDVPRLNIVLQAGGYRTWADGTVATSCKKYLVGATNYAYAGATGDGVYRIDVDGAGALTATDVVCDMTTDGGGWTLIQRRVNGAVDFYRTYAEYASGFGTAATEYWIGNNRIAALTVAGSTLRIDLSRTNGQTAYEQYSSFKVNPQNDGYRLTVSGASGSAGDSMTYQNGQPFSTKDVDLDADPNDNCAVHYKGAWWYTACHHSNLNGLYLNGPHASYADGMEWEGWTGQYESMKTTEMKVREN